MRPDWETHALGEQSVRAFRMAARLRLGAVALFVPVVAFAAARGEAGWVEPLDLLIPYAAVVAAIFALRARAWVQHLGPYTFALDALVVFGLQWRSMPSSPFPAGVAGFTLGLFVMLVLLGGASMRWRATLATALLGVPLQVLLMQKAGVGTGAQAAAVVVLLSSALTQSLFVRRFRAMVSTSATREVAWRIENERAERLEAANRTIAKLYATSVEQKAKLEQLQQEKEVLTSLLVHDLRAPLGAVKANLSFLKGEVGPLADEDVTEAVTESLQVTDRLSGMIGDLLNITKLESGAFQVQLDDVLANTTLQALGKQLAPQAKSRNLKISVHTEDFSFEGDAALLMRTLENLSSNALRYTPAGGRVHLEARREGDQVVLAVRNDGTPIPPSARATLFDKFTQGDDPKANRRAGWGLGLYFCKLCVEAHHGTIGIEDAPGWPTSFVLRLPAKGAVRQAA